jgi:hypothetical protein
MENETDKLLGVIAEQCIILDEILATQKHIRDVVQAKDWTALEATLVAFDKRADEYAAKEDEFMALREAMSASDMTEQVRHGLTMVRRKLALSRIENDALNEYFKIITHFLQGVFNSVAENRTSKVYSRTGGIVRSQPERLVLDALL